MMMHEHAVVFNVHGGLANNHALTHDYLWFWWL